MRESRRTGRRLPAVLTSALAALAVAVPLGASATAAPQPAETGKVRTAPGAERIDDSYLVVLKDSATSLRAAPRAADDLTRRHGGEVRRVWKDALHGFAARMSPAQAARMAADPRVDYVEQDVVVRTQAVQDNPPSWGLDRVDQRSRTLNQKYGYVTTASNVTAYIVDTGIRTSHTTFGGRATWGRNSIDSNNTDCNGHGTHVAGTVGGSHYGVAKGVKLVAVKVLNCQGSGTLSALVDGLNWVAANARKPAVVNLSLGFGGANSTADSAVRNVISKGITVVAAGGNSGQDACNYSPGRVSEAITVGATDSGDKRASFSNYGRCLDIFAPGVSIRSSWKDSNTSSKVLNGTSMATPHVAGAAALYLAAHTGASPATVSAQLRGVATVGTVSNGGSGSPNLLLYSRSDLVTVKNPGNRYSFTDRPITQRMYAYGGFTPYKWTATGLPPGLTINATTGVISGYIYFPGYFSVKVTATDAKGKVGSAAFRWTVRDLDNCRQVICP